VLDLPFLERIPRAFIYVALAAWLMTMVGWVKSAATSNHTK
jgi:hypothetical protein